MEMEAGGIDLADLGGASVTPDAIAVGGDGVMGDGIDVAAQEGIPADAVNIEEDAGTGEEMDPKVAARLKMLLDHIDPTFRDVFVSMLKQPIKQHNNRGRLEWSEASTFRSIPRKATCSSSWRRWD
ncbi:unnamed protein product [Urochloa humidicola]